MTRKVISPVNVKEREELDLRSGDTVKVYQKIQEKGKTRLQIFEGLVLARKHGKTAGSTFTVRRVIDGVGVERIFPLYSPNIDKIEVVKRSKVRRAKLYHIRKKAAKEMSKRMKMEMIDIRTQSEREQKEKIAKEQAEAEARAEEAKQRAVAQEAKQKAAAKQQPTTDPVSHSAGAGDQQPTTANQQPTTEKTEEKEEEKTK